MICLNALNHKFQNFNQILPFMPLMQPSNHLHDFPHSRHPTRQGLIRNSPHRPRIDSVVRCWRWAANRLRCRLQQIRVLRHLSTVHVPKNCLSKADIQWYSDLEAALSTFAAPALDAWTPRNVIVLSGNWLRRGGGFPTGKCTMAEVSACC